MIEKRQFEDRNSFTHDDYRAMIEAGRETLSDDNLAILLALYETASMAAAARMVKQPVAVLRETFHSIAFDLGFLDARIERVRKDGHLYRKRLGAKAYEMVLAEIEMEDEDRLILEAAAEAPNQVVAAKSLGMTFADFEARFKAIRNRYDF